MFTCRRKIIIIGIDNSIIDNIRKNINIEQENSKTQSRALKTPALLQQSCEDFPFKTNHQNLSQSNEVLRLKDSLEIPQHIFPFS